MWGALVATMLVMFILGFFLDFIEIVFVVVPIVAPPLIVLGADPVWLAILMALNLQTSFLTPPFGFALFYLRGAAPDGVETLDIWRGAIPFIGLQLLMILLVASIPALATYLPDLLR
ncbi:MAG: C4-dicarboxylate TRAP transporter large permease protein DctM [Hyphomonas sp. TMED17]|nr:MAG: C4-dicarboxylate TRAP transporter large permease protein DctM [Hyphomonas sp. TMED17]